MCDPIVRCPDRSSQALCTGVAMGSVSPFAVTRFGMEDRLLIAKTSGTVSRIRCEIGLEYLPSYSDVDTELNHVRVSRPN
jgi:hypothetical protein